MQIRTKTDGELNGLLSTEVDFYSEVEKDTVIWFAKQTIVDERENQWNGKMTGSQLLYLLVNKFIVKKGHDWYMVRYIGKDNATFDQLNKQLFINQILKLS